MFTERRDLRKNNGSSLLVGCLIVAALYFAREVFIPLALAGLVAFLLAPVATRLERWGIQRTLASLLVIGLSFACVCTICWVVLGQIYNLAVELPLYQQNVTRKIDALHLHSAGKLTSTIQMLGEISKQISIGDSAVPLAPPPVSSTRRGRAASAQPSLGSDASHKATEPIPVRVEEPDESLLMVASRNIQPLISPLATAFIVVVFVIFILLARDDLRDRAVRLVGSSRIHITTVAMTDASARVSRYLLMQFLVNLIYGAVVGLALWGIGVPHPLLWAVMTFLLRFIPYVGIMAAGLGPILVAIAVSPNWTMGAWTFGLYVAMELISANVVEPLLYGSSTGVSALAILIAAIFWTWLWGLAGLLLSTPLTVCLIVIGRHVPHLGFVGVLFSEETVLDPSQRLYQRILASATDDAARLLDQQMQTRSREDVFDNVVIPAITLIEAGRHSDAIDAALAEEALQSIEELIEQQWTSPAEPRSATDKRPRIVCIPARDFADEIACQLLMRVTSDSYRGRLIPADLLTSNVLENIAADLPDIVCVVGIPPHAIRHIRLRCHHLRARFPDLVIVACILSVECDLSNIRGRIPLEDAQHVVCSLLQGKEYLTALSDPAAINPPADTSLLEAPPAAAAQPAEEFKGLNVLDESLDDIFDRITQNLSKALETPIAIISAYDGDHLVLKSQCGLPADDLDTARALCSLSMWSQPILEKSCVVVPDTAEDDRFSSDHFFLEKGIRFYAAAPIVGQDGQEIGCLCVLDTRPRQITDQQKDLLLSLADSATNAIELQAAAAGE